METKEKNQRLISIGKPIFFQKKIWPSLSLLNSGDGTNSKNPKTGFTLIELLVVIAIIGLLASVVLVALNGARQKSRDAKRAADIAQLSQAMELFYNDHNSYPTTNGSVSVTTYGILSATSAVCTGGTAGCVDYLVPTYLSKIPLSPVPVDGATCAASYAGATANDYQYAGTGNGVNTVANYTITFCISSQVGTLPAGIHTLTAGGIQ